MSSRACVWRVFLDDDSGGGELTGHLEAKGDARDDNDCQSRSLCRERLLDEGRYGGQRSFTAARRKHSEERRLCPRFAFENVHLSQNLQLRRSPTACTSDGIQCVCPQLRIGTMAVLVGSPILLGLVLAPRALGRQRNVGVGRLACTQIE